MRGLELTGSEIRYRDDLPVPPPGHGEVSVRVTCAGICETDLQLMQGYMGFQGIPGHEFVGVAENGKYAGRRVVGEINCPCLDCDLCQGGLTNHCPYRTVLGIVNRNGAFAERLTLPEGNLHPVPDELADEVAVFTEPVAAAFQIPVQIPELRGQRILVLGDGRLGNLCAQVLKLHGAEVVACGKHSRKLDLIAACGIETVLLSEFHPRKKFDVVVESTGRATGLETALRSVLPRGKVIMKTTVAGMHPMNLANVVIDEVTIVGSRCGPFKPALDALVRKEIRVEPMIESIRPLSEGVEALIAARMNSTLKTLLKP